MVNFTGEDGQTSLIVRFGLRGKWYSYNPMIIMLVVMVPLSKEGWQSSRRSHKGEKEARESQNAEDDSRIAHQMQENIN